MPTKNGRYAVNRGKVFERELVDYFTAALNITCHRAVANQNITNSRIGFPDLVGLPDLAVEAKRTNRLNLNEALAQSIRNAGPTDMPIVITRADRQPLPDARVILRLSDFTRLYASHLKVLGHV